MPRGETARYRGYKITLDERGAHVFDPRNPRGPALCRFATAEEARQWVRAATGMAHPARLKPR
jgi:hypothetical protein